MFTTDLIWIPNLSSAGDERGAIKIAFGVAKRSASVIPISNPTHPFDTKSECYIIIATMIIALFAQLFGRLTNNCLLKFRYRQFTFVYQKILLGRAGCTELITS